MHALVRDLTRTRINLIRAPEMTVLVEDVVERSGVTRRVTESKDHRLAVGQATLGNLEDRLVHSGRFVEHVERR